MSISPGRFKFAYRRDLDLDLARIRSTVTGPILICSLIEDSECKSMAIPHLFSSITNNNMESIRFPIRDKFIPSRMSDFVLLIHQLVTHIQQGKKVIVHCNGGKGRTGLTVVCILIMSGVDYFEAIRLVRQARPGTIKNPLQRLWAYRFSQVWRQYLRLERERRENKVYGIGCVLSGTIVALLFLFFLLLLLLSS